MNEYKEYFQQAIPVFPQSGNRALVEAGHLYAGQEPSWEQEISLQVGVAAYEALMELGMDVSTMLFIDDYNGQGSLDETLAIYEAMLKNTGFTPSIIVVEASLVGEASSLIRLLDDKKKIVEKKAHISLKNGAAGLIRLATYNGASLLRKYSCEALDAALYLKKASMTDGGLLVTVLPKSYQEQQMKTKTVVRATGCSAPILNVYFDEYGKIEVDFDY